MPQAASFRSASPTAPARTAAPRRSPRSPTLTRSTLPELRAFLLHLASERGLAVNSLHAYRRDLEDADDHFRESGKTLVTAGAADYRGYLQSQSRKGQSTKTVARRLAAIRVFLRFLASEARDTAAILQQLERPKPEQSLPKILSRAHVNQLLASPDPK